MSAEQEMTNVEGQHEAGEPGKVDTAREVIFGADGKEMYPDCECVCCDFDCWCSLCCACVIACGNFQKQVNLTKMRNQTLGKGADEVEDNSMCCFCSILWAELVPLMIVSVLAAVTEGAGAVAYLPLYSCAICMYRQKLAETMEFAPVDAFKTWCCSLWCPCCTFVQDKKAIELYQHRPVSLVGQAVGAVNNVLGLNKTSPA